MTVKVGSCIQGRVLAQLRDGRMNQRGHRSARSLAAWGILSGGAP